MRGKIFRTKLKLLQKLVTMTLKLMNEHFMQCLIHARMAITLKIRENPVLIHVIISK